MTSSNFKVIIFAVFGVFANFTLMAQENTDSAIVRFLRTKPDIPSPVIKIEKQGKKTIRSQNFFSSPNDPLKDDSLTFRTFLFGSSESHASKYFLIEVKSPKHVTYKIIDELTLEAGLDTLLGFLRPYKLSESKQAQIINQFSFTYY